jgi:transcriptional regulator with XRE-family HTH domain
MSGAVRIARSISAAECREARTMLGWRLAQLATYSSVAIRTIVDFEEGVRAPRARTLTALAECFETAGVIFVEGNGDGPGVRLRKVAKR